MRLLESMLLWTKMSLKKFHCDGAWLQSPFFDGSSGWDSFLSLLYYILPTRFPPSKMFMYVQTPLSLFLTFVDTGCFLSLSFIYRSQASKVLAFSQARWIAWVKRTPQRVNAPPCRRHGSPCMASASALYGGRKRSLSPCLQKPEFLYRATNLSGCEPLST